jgi:hypothetical protein
MEDVRVVEGGGEKKEKAKLDVDPLKNMKRAKVAAGKDPDSVIDDYDFGYDVDKADIETRRSYFKKEANLTRGMLVEGRNPVDDKIEGGGLDEIMDMFVEKEGEKGKEEEGKEEEFPIAKEAAALEEKVEEEVREVREEGKKEGEEEVSKKKEDEDKSGKAEKAEKEEKEEPAAQKAASPAQKKAAELVPKWRDPMTGTVVDVEKRKAYLKTSAPFKECWEGVLAKCVQSLGKSELERRVAAVAKGTGRKATPSMAFCALAECGGVVRHAVKKLELPGYREEMSLAEEVCQTSQYVKVSRKEKRTPEGKKGGKSPKGKSPQGKRGFEEASAAGAEGSEKRSSSAFWRDPVSGEVMDAQARKQHLLSSATYKSCWEEVLGKLVQSAGKGEIERSIGRVCGAVKGVSPETAFCSLAECAGQPQHSIVKLRHPGYVEEMKLAVEVCQVAQYIKVSPKKKKRSPKKGGE